MTSALLLDLDDTLLHNSMGEFLPRYFGALTSAVAEHMAAEPFLRALRHATQQMIANTDVAQTNQAVFWRSFEPLLTVDRAVIEPVLNQFYDEVFPTLDSMTEPVSGARALIDAAKDAGWKVALATNPVFPRVAILHRMAWAGLDEGSFDLVTSYEIMSSTKPHAAYFRQVADLLGVAPSNCVMAGNHLANDIVGAAREGMRTFWVNDWPIDDADVSPDAQGSLDDLRHWLFAAPQPH